MGAKLSFRDFLKRGLAVGSCCGLAPPSVACANHHVTVPSHQWRHLLSQWLSPASWWGEDLPGVQMRKINWQEQSLPRFTELNCLADDYFSRDWCHVKLVSFAVEPRLLHGEPNAATHVRHQVTGANNDISSELSTPLPLLSFNVLLKSVETKINHMTFFSNNSRQDHSCETVLGLLHQCFWWFRPGLDFVVHWIHHCITALHHPTTMCIHLCVNVCGAECVSLCVDPVFRQLQKRSSLGGCMQQCGLEPLPRSPLCAKAKARIRDGGGAYHGPLLYLDWQTNSSFTQALFTKGSNPDLWESCL